MPLRVFVTVGTHEQPFSRLLLAAKRAAETLENTEWIVQSGTGTFEAGHVIRVEPYFAHDEIRAWNTWAEVVLSHASPGAVFDALGAEAQPIVVPRRRVHGEHVNDHQVQFADRLKALELAQVAENEVEVITMLQTAVLEDAADRRSRLAAIHEASRERSAAFVAEFSQAIENLRSPRTAVKRARTL